MIPDVLIDRLHHLRLLIFHIGTFVQTETSDFIRRFSEGWSSLFLFRLKADLLKVMTRLGFVMTCSIGYIRLDPPVGSGWKSVAVRRVRDGVLSSASLSEH